jgi:cation diffusion facilitator CzcD-associated flavoprotein CzcO
MLKEGMMNELVRPVETIIGREAPGIGKRRVDPVLDAGALRALAFLGDPPADWVMPRPGIDHDVLIVGAGQNGVALAFNLRRAGVHKVKVIDAAPEERAGIWRGPARMNVLRTPKSTGGPELGIPELSFRYWYEARHGAAAYDRIGFIKRTDWADYLDWFRELVGIEPRYRTRLVLIEPEGDHFRLTLEREGERSVETARHVLLANGIVAFGGPYVPEEILLALPADAYAHTADDIDFAALRGKRVAVLGGAASAFDAAGTAVEHGAVEVHLFSRRDAVANHTPARSRGYPGIVNNFARLDDADRWWFAPTLKRLGTTAPEEAVRRAAAFPNFFLHLGARWSGLRHEDGKLRFSDQGEKFAFDHLILGTGYCADPERQPELQAIAGAIAHWRDRYTPPADLADDELASSPYVGTSYQLLEREPGKAPYLERIHLVSAAASLSFGRPIGDVPSMTNGLPVVIADIVRDLFFSDYEAHQAKTRQPPAPSAFDPALYASALWQGNESGLVQKAPYEEADEENPHARRSQESELLQRRTRHVSTTRGRAKRLSIPT